MIMTGSKPIAFTFAAPANIVFGKGVVSQLPKVSSGFGKTILFFYSNSVASYLDPIRNSFTDLQISSTEIVVHGEPKIGLVNEYTSLARSIHPDVIIGMGGGSVVDYAKAVSAMTTNPGNISDYVEVVGKGLPLKAIPVPLIAVPTTAGTGSEVTKNAVIAIPEEHVKVSLRSPSMIPRTAIIDPQLTYGLPRDISISTGLDALTQVLEPFVCRKANPIADVFSREGLGRVINALRRVSQDGFDEQARSEMCWVSLLGGLALANAGLGAVHGFAAPIGGLFDAPHGGVCAALLPNVVKTNIFAMLEREPDNPAISAYSETARFLSGNNSASVKDCSVILNEFCQELNSPGLSTYGIEPSHFPMIVEKAKVASSMQTNPIILSDEELFQILELSL
jgi:alcohol dehydrogenase class IV